MVFKKFKVNVDGTNPRTCAEIARHAGRFNSTIVVECGGKTVSMKSLIGLISVGLMPNDEITIRADGEDELDALDEMIACVS